MSHKMTTSETGLASKCRSWGCTNRQKYGRKVGRFFVQILFSSFGATRFLLPNAGIFLVVALFQFVFGTKLPTPSLEI